MYFSDAWAVSAKSWLICRRSHTCLYLSSLLNLYITLYKTTPMVSKTPHNLLVCQFQQFLDANRSTYHQQHVQYQYNSLGQLLLGLDRELISAFWTRAYVRQCTKIYHENSWVLWFMVYFFLYFYSRLELLLLLSLYSFNSTPEPRMYLDHGGTRKGDISPSWGQPNMRVHTVLSRRRARQGPGERDVQMPLSCLPGP